LHPDDASQHAAGLDAARALSDGESTTFEYRFRHKDGSWRWIRTQSTPLRRDVTGAVTQLASLGIDVTEEKLHQAAVLEAAALDSFRSRLADELRDVDNRAAVELRAAQLVAEHLGVAGAHFVTIESTRYDQAWPVDVSGSRPKVASASAH
jgi:PAS domain-containing protein